ncbi:1-acyl-sn-glycerol-3-phosphate acyltransferase epsilon-like [Tropilaelaps mercedesae]|uniref:1-acyl-sn-glycerol-3-phosphate acyltransferase epsilon-like n=1 Tax=Tropilaelaps mercedesae TaxID=418985 RepID=A0A1V9XXW9_9ACAR|nr:1-acyl-sn-glycerol-3-phosphate acyltransferase epsilon-like [Tropilaelaps mercedesae]
MESAGKWENAMRSLVVGVLSVIWHLITQHVNLIVMAALTWTYFLIWPVAYVIGIPRWKPLDVYFKIYSHFVILQNIELLGVKLYFYGGFPDICDKEENSVIIANHQSECK